MHSTNYRNTLIEIADDCPVTVGTPPPLRGEKRSVANMQYEMLVDNPYSYTSDDVMFAVFAARKAVPEAEMDGAREQFFSKGQPCFRASPLTKRYGWGIHANDDGKIALFGVESEVYVALAEDESVVKKQAMRSKRAR